MGQVEDTLPTEQAAEFAGVNIPTIERYKTAGFLTPTQNEEGHDLYNVEELSKVFELSPKKAETRRKNLTKKKLSKTNALLLEKDRVMAEKDIQIQDLKDQRAWLQSRVASLEAELQEFKKQIITPAPSPEPHPDVAEEETYLPTNESWATRFLRYFGFVEQHQKPVQALPKPPQETSSAVEQPEQDNLVTLQERRDSPRTTPNKPVGDRPFRRKKIGNDEDLLGLLGQDAGEEK